MTRRIIGVCGYATAGKDTVADHLVTAHGFTRVAFADALKEMALDIDPVMHRTEVEGDDVLLSELVRHYGWDGAKVDAEVRTFLQRLGGAVRKADPEFWVNAAQQRLANVPGDVVLADVRFPNEAEWVRMWAPRVYTAAARATAPGTLVRVTRPGVGPVNGHESETALDGVPVGVVLENRGSVEDLHTLVDAVLA